MNWEVWAMIEQLTSVMRELDSRSDDGIDVHLLWSEHDDELVVAVADNKNGDRFLLDVEPGENALEVFRHPFAYAAWRGIGRCASRSAHGAVGSSG
jgi:hypothetical protein